MTIKVDIYSQVSFANAIRRILLSEVPAPAIELVEIRENKSVLADEMLAHRLGLVPIRINRLLLEKTECDCDSYCARCSVRFFLKENNTSTRVLAVTGASLLPENPTDAEAHPSLLVKLAPGHEIDLVCIARRGVPLSHAKHVPVTVVGFNYDSRNKLRGTNLWLENDVQKEWPGINQTETREWGEAQCVELDIEVVEGSCRPREVLRAALDVFKVKMSAILDRLE